MAGQRSTEGDSYLPPRSERNRWADYYSTHTPALFAAARPAGRRWPAKLEVLATCSMVLVDDCYTIVRLEAHPLLFTEALLYILSQGVWRSKCAPPLHF